MAVIAICGWTGSGKTYVALRLAEEITRRNNGRMGLSANFHINSKGFLVHPEYFGDPMEFIGMEKKVCILDDGATWFGARRWQDLPFEVQDKIINNRKDGLKIIVTTQYFDSLDKMIRENCHQYWECTKLFGPEDEDMNPEKPWGLIKVVRYHPRDWDKIRRRPLDKKYFLVRKKYTDMYDTYEKVRPRPPSVGINSKMKRPEASKELRDRVKVQRQEIEEMKILDVKRSRGRPKKIKLMIH